MPNANALLQELTRTFSACGEEVVSQNELVIPVATDHAALEEIYKILPAKFPKLFEELLLNYRWFQAEIDGTLRLLPNPPGNGLTGFLDAVTKDNVMFKVCTGHGYLQFAFGEDVSYDPICFDFEKRTKSKDLAIVRLDHEEILCRERIRVLEIVAPSFKDLVLQILSGK